MASASKSTHKLTREQAEEIRRKYDVGGINQSELAQEYGVSQAAIWAILNNKVHVFTPLTETERRRNKQDCRLKLDFGITLLQWEEMLEDAGYACESCGAHLADQPPHPKTGEPFLNCDHDHVTGKVRGVLCTRCNLILGMAGDSIERLQGMIDYLNLSAEDKA